MNYRELGKTGLMVSEIGFGAEWMERHTPAECRSVLDRAEELGINILDCWMSDPRVRDSLGQALAGRRERWYIQGHIGSTWQGGQYVRTRDVDQCRAAFEDLLARLGTDYIDLGMIHFVDTEADWEGAMNTPFLDYVKELKAKGTIRHIGMSTHNPETARMAAEDGEIEMILFSINPAFDMMPPVTDLEEYFAEKYDENLGGIAPEREELYKLCEQKQVGITVMKGYAGGRLFHAKTSPFGVALTPVQCLHYALTRPAVASVMCGARSIKDLKTSIAYENAAEEERDYAAAFASMPKISWVGHCMYCGHCAPCPKGINVASVTKFLNLCRAQGEIPETVREHYAALPRKAGECVQCGACEKRCPFGVAVMENMKRAEALFGA